MKVAIELGLSPPRDVVAHADEVIDRRGGPRCAIGDVTRASDETLRATLVAGATAYIQQVRRGRSTPSPWLAELLKRKPPKLTAVALANKTARIAWKLMVSGQRYDRAQAAAPAKATV